MERRHHHGHHHGHHHDHHHSHHQSQHHSHHHSHHHSNRPMEPGQPGPSTSRTEHHHQSPSERALSNFLKNLRVLQRLSEAAQIEQFTKMLNAINPTGRTLDYRSSLPWSLKRIEFFQSLPTKDQTKYLQQVYEWRRIKFPRNTKTDIEYVAYLLPGLAQFVRTIRTGAFDAKRDGNWFIWWGNGFVRRQVEEGLKPGDAYKADRQLLEHMMQYEAIHGHVSVVPRSRDDPLVLPSISEILRPRHTPY
ncbi:hypothetical protein F4776DRAFT_666545 [Hypoxylon sp. NC0597]|nr:hypothetical protein F4776DRAFT_666545 [Hypoxylon sp. NC0597]